MVHRDGTITLFLGLFETYNGGPTFCLPQQFDLTVSPPLLLSRGVLRVDSIAPVPSACFVFKHAMMKVHSC